MIDSSTIPLDKEVYCFELDNVLYPEQDYMLQVYYLFAQFIEFSEGFPPANDLALFMKNVYANKGKDAVFSLASETFGFGVKYEENLQRLEANAQLPLKLVIFKEVDVFLHLLFEKGKKIAILTQGNPVEQLNKLKHIDWGRLEAYRNSLRVYFVDELVYRNYEPIDYIAEDYKVTKDRIHFIKRW